MELKNKNDTISRQAAIDATWEEPTYTDPLNVLTEVRDKIRALPSAQPDIVRDIATILENEQDMRVILQNAQLTQSSAVQRVESVGDCIVRQAAIDALVKAIREDPYYDSNEAINGLGVCDVRVILNDLPSAQPELTEDDWKLIRQMRSNYNGTYAKVIDKLIATSQPEIVRCKDCKYWQDQEEGIVEVPICARLENKYEKFPLVMLIDGDGFCSYAERRTDGVDS